MAGEKRKVKLPVALLWSRLMPAAAGCLLATVLVVARDWSVAMAAAV